MKFTINHGNNYLFFMDFLRSPKSRFWSMRLPAEKVPGPLKILLIGCLAVVLTSCSNTKPASPEAPKPASMGDLNVNARSVSWTSYANYLVFLPADYHDTDSRRWPLILFLHGIGE